MDEQTIKTIALSTAEAIAAEDADDSTETTRSLIFESGDLTFFLSTEYVTEIINDHSITALPVVPKYIRGIINLRGQILPVIDLRCMMGKDATNYSSKTCIIVLNIDSIPIGIIVDEVRSVIDVDVTRIQPLPLKRQKELADGMLKLDDGTVAMSLDCRAIIRAS